MDQTYPKVKKVYWYDLFIGGILVLLTWTAVTALQPDWRLHVSFLDVGQGDAAFITTYEGNQVLIDGGPDSSVLAKLGREMPFYDRTIDLIVLTHPHADHMNGLIEVLKRYRVKKVLLTKVTHNSAAYQILEDLLVQKGVETATVRAGQRIILDGATVLQILYPPQSLQGQLFDDLNESSIVARLTFGQNSFLFTGDASKEEERGVLSSGRPVAAEVLKVGHHGSNKSSGEVFLKAVAPRYAVVSVGSDNSYGHPHEETLRALEAVGAEILRTDKAGDIKFACDGVQGCVYNN